MDGSVACGPLLGRNGFPARNRSCPIFFFFAALDSKGPPTPDVSTTFPATFSRFDESPGFLTFKTMKCPKGQRLIHPRSRRQGCARHTGQLSLNSLGYHRWDNKSASDAPEGAPPYPCGSNRCARRPPLPVLELQRPAPSGSILMRTGASQTWSLAGPPASAGAGRPTPLQSISHPPFFRVFGHAPGISSSSPFQT